MLLDFAATILLYVQLVTEFGAPTLCERFAENLV